MKKILRKPLLFILAAALMMPVTMLAQSDKEKKDKDKEKKESEQIIITRKKDSGEKVVIEINGDKVTVNGKPVEEYTGEGVTVRRGRAANAFGVLDRFNSNNEWNYFDGSAGNTYSVFGADSNRAMLGVTTNDADKGVVIEDITDKSGASKAGLKEGDIILKIDDKTIKNPDHLTEVIRSHKPGDKVGITYERDGKEQKTTAELGKWKGLSFTPGVQNYKMDFPKIEQTIPRVRTPYSQNWSYSGGAPKLGLSVQDTDDGKGVKVIEVDHESNASKAGLKEEDIITEVEGKAVNSADEVAKIIKESKDKNSVMVKLLRGGKTQNIEVKIPRKLKTADL